MKTRTNISQPFADFLMALKRTVPHKILSFRLGISPNTLENWKGYAETGEPKAEIGKIALVLRALDITQDVVGLEGWFDPETLELLKDHLKTYSKPPRKWWHEYLEGDQEFRKYVPPSIQPGALDLEVLQRSGVLNTFRIILGRNPAREVRVAELVEHELRKEKPRFRLLASSAYNYLHPAGVVWGQTGLGEAILRGKARFEVVLQSPFSLFTVARALANRVSWNQWEDRGMVRRLQELLDVPSIKIYITGLPINNSIFLTSDYSFYDPYLWSAPGESRRTENNFWVFEFVRVDDRDHDCYGLLERHFEFLLRRSIRLERLLEKYDEANTRFNTLLDRCRQDVDYGPLLDEALALRLAPCILEESVKAVPPETS
jgi:hypothetical protein